MLVKMKCILLLVLCTMMTACISLTNPDDDNEKIEAYFIEQDSQDVVVDPSYKYDVSIEGDSNKVVLKGNIQEILITGSYNYVIIEDDTHVDDLSITGMNNMVIKGGEQDLFIEALTLSGSRNVISLDGYEKLTDSGEDNQVLNTASTSE